MPARPVSGPEFAFASVEAAWFETMRVVAAGGAVSGAPLLVLRCLDGLYRKRRIELLHAKILRLWGVRGRAPNPAWPRERSDWRLWREAMRELDDKLQAAGLVAAGLDGSLLDAAD